MTPRPLRLALIAALMLAPMALGVALGERQHRRDLAARRAESTAVVPPVAEERPPGTELLPFLDPGSPTAVAIRAEMAGEGAR